MYRSLVLLGSCLCDGRVGILLTPLLILLPAAPHTLGTWEHLDLAYCALGPCPLLVLGEPGLTHLVPSLGQPPLSYGLRLAAAPLPPHAPTIPWRLCPLNLNLSRFSPFKFEKAYGHPSQPGGYRNLGEGDKPARFPLFKRILLSESRVSDHDDIWALPPAIAGF